MCCRLFLPPLLALFSKGHCLTLVSFFHSSRGAGIFILPPLPIYWQDYPGPSFGQGDCVIPLRVLSHTVPSDALHLLLPVVALSLHSPLCVRPCLLRVAFARQPPLPPTVRISANAPTGDIQCCQWGRAGFPVLPSCKTPSVEAEGNCVKEGCMSPFSHFIQIAIQK